MRYVIYVATSDDMQEMHEATVQEADRDFLERLVVPTLRPLTDDDYARSMAVLLHTFARSSYILDGQDLYWCTEWVPGLVVVRFSPTGQMAWSALRSPIPEFGGRAGIQADIDAFDEDAVNHQRNLVFEAWDAQFDEQQRTWAQFVPASPETAAVHDAALARANCIGDALKEKYGGTFEAWASECRRNIEAMAGEGIRLQ